MSAGVLDLTGPVVCWGITALAAAAFVVGIVVVPRRIRRRGRLGAGAITLQALTLLVCTVLALLATGVWLNRQFTFFGSWGDLTAGPAHQTTSLHGAATAAGAAPSGAGIGRGAGFPATAAEAQALAAARTAPVSAQQADPLHDPALAGVTGSDAGQDIMVTIPAHDSDVTQKAMVHLPAGYLSHPHARYPVLLAFTGIPGSPRTWEQSFSLGDRMDRAAARHELAAAIVVIPIVYPGRTDTECVDPDDGHQRYETWLSRDVPAWIHAHLRSVENPLAWASIGYSAGGWCSSMLAVRHPDVERAAVSLGGYFVVDYDPHQVHTRPDDPRYDLPRVAARTRPPVALYFFSGGEDPYTQPSLGRMQKAVAAPTALTVQRSAHGGHLVPLWVAQMDTVQTWLAQNSAGFAPRT